MRVCSKCKVEKDESEFRKNASKKTGLTSQCKKCIKAAAIRWNERYQSGDKYKKQHIRYVKTNKKKINENSRSHQSKNTHSLGDAYIKARLKRKGFTKEQILANPDILEAQRLIIKIKRHVKEKTNN